MAKYGTVETRPSLYWSGNFDITERKPAPVRAFLRFNQRVTEFMWFASGIAPRTGRKGAETTHLVKLSKSVLGPQSQVWVGGSENTQYHVWNRGCVFLLVNNHKGFVFENMAKSDLYEVMARIDEFVDAFCRATMGDNRADWIFPFADVVLHSDGRKGRVLTVDPQGVVSVRLEGELEGEGPIDVPFAAWREHMAKSKGSV